MASPVRVVGVYSGVEGSFCPTSRRIRIERVPETCGVALSPGHEVNLNMFASVVEASEQWETCVVLAGEKTLLFDHLLQNVKRRRVCVATEGAPRGPALPRAIPNIPVEWVDWKGRPHRGLLRTKKLVYDTEGLRSDCFLTVERMDGVPVEISDLSRDTLTLSKPPFRLVMDYSHSLFSQHGRWWERVDALLGDGGREPLTARLRRGLSEEEVALLSRRFGQKGLDRSLGL